MRRGRGAVADRLVRTALRAFPPAFRVRHGTDMVALHRDRYADVRRRWFGARLRYMTGVLIELVWSGVRERFRASRLAHARPRTLEFMWQDLVLASRAVVRSPRFLLLAVLPMALGIGATTATFSVADGVFLRPLPYAEPDRLLVVGSTYEGSRPQGVSIPNYRDLVERQTSLDALAAIGGGSFFLETDEGTVRVPLGRVSPGFFEILGVVPARGRTFRFDDRHVAILSHAEWIERWGADDGVIGQVVRLELSGRGEGTRVPYVIVGVLPPAFTPPEGVGRLGEPRIWVPIDLTGPGYDDTRAYSLIDAVGRLRDGVRLEVVREELGSIARALAVEYPDDNMRDGLPRSLVAETLHAYTVGEAGSRIMLLLGAVGGLLLIACVNVAHLFLVRGSGQRREIALRYALGAGRVRVARQVLAESGIVALVGGAGGVLVAWGAVAWFVRASPGDIPRLGEVAVNWRALLFAIVAAVVSALGAGVFPVVDASQRQPDEVLRMGGRGTSRRLARWRSVLIGMETAVAVVLISAAALAMTGFLRVMNRDLGFDPTGIATLRVDLGNSYEAEAARATVVQALVRALEERPGIQSVTGSVFGLADAAPLSTRLSIDGGADTVVVTTRTVIPGFFEALDVPLVEGRPFAADDDLNAPPVVILSRSLARQLVGERSPLGRTITFPAERRFTVVGVVEDVRDGPKSEPRATVYQPYLQRPWLATQRFMVAYSGDLGVAAVTIRNAITSVDRNIPLPTVSTLEDDLAATMAQPRFYSVVLSGFSAVALILAAVGLYATLSFMVTGRRQEIGVRIALGASPRRVVAFVAGHGAMIVAGGVAAGILLVGWMNDLVRAVTVGAEPRDPWTVGAAALLIGLTAVAACWIPAGRAARVEPVEILKAE